jgi:hypothetical protein
LRGNRGCVVSEAVKQRVSELLEQARIVPKKYTGPYLTDYIEVIHELQSKNLTWDETRDWIKARDEEFDFSVQSMCTLYRKWRAERADTAEAEQSEAQS